MASVQHETEREESDEDCEVYFLKPVNEYNIMDKIKEANKELFSDEIGTDNELMAESQQSRKVSFAANLEEYESQNGINLKELEDELGKSHIEINEENLQKIMIKQKLEIITEEETVNKIEIHVNETNSQKKTEEKQTLTAMKDNEAKENINENEQIQLKSSLEFANVDETVDETVEEICEEILIMDMESENFNEKIITKFDSPAVVHRRMLKQLTFDYTEDNDEQDNESLTNLLISDNENDPNEDEVCNEEYNCNESINEDTDTEDKMPTTCTEYEDDDEEDDKLSIIVASYLHDDLVCNKTSLTSTCIKNSPNSSKPRKLPFNQRFSLRRKTKTSNSIGSCLSRHVSNNPRFMPPPEVTDLKLHYKTCCDFKNYPQNLPKYSGYLSEYGLSREQLIERERKLQQKQHDKVVDTLKTSEVQMRKMHDNERAFITWLKNKMRFPINKTRNMFDVNRTFGLRKCTSVGGNKLSDDTKQILNTTKYRSISAKLKEA